MLPDTSRKSKWYGGCSVPPDALKPSRRSASFAFCCRNFKRSRGDSGFYLVEIQLPDVPLELLVRPIVGRYQSMKDNVRVVHIESVSSFVSACTNGGIAQFTTATPDLIPP